MIALPIGAIPPSKTRVLLAVVKCSSPRTVRRVAAEAGYGIEWTHECLTWLRRNGLVDWTEGQRSTLRPLVEVAR